MKSQGFPYHVNKEGFLGRCKAKPGNCPMVQSRHITLDAEQKRGLLRWKNAELLKEGNGEIVLSSDLTLEMADSWVAAGAPLPVKKVSLTTTEREIELIKCHEKRLLRGASLPEHKRIDFEEVAGLTSVHDKLQYLVGRDLTSHYNAENVTSPKDKGWRGQVIERALGLQRNNDHAPDTLEGELKSVQADYMGKATQTMALTSFNPDAISVGSTRDVILGVEFEKTLLYKKIENLFIVPVFSADDGGVEVKKAVFLSLKDHPEVKQAIQREYEFLANKLRFALKNTKNARLSSSEINKGMDLQYLHVRPKGAGGNSPRTFAFYFFARGVNKLVELAE